MDEPVMGGLPVLSRSVFRNEAFLRNMAIKSVPAEFSTLRGGDKQTYAVVKVIVSETGEVIEAIYLFGPPELGALAIETAKEWRFMPLSVNGLTVRVESTLTFPVKTIDYQAPR
jgi:hypothetical protein